MSSHQPLNLRLVLRVSRDDIDRVRAAAGLVPVSAWVRQAIHEKLERDAEAKS